MSRKTGTLLRGMELVVIIVLEIVFNVFKEDFMFDVKQSVENI
jgi:hypothetical protein